MDLVPVEWSEIKSEAREEMNNLMDQLRAVQAMITTYKQLEAAQTELDRISCKTPNWVYFVRVDNDPVYAPIDAFLRHNAVFCGFIVITPFANPKLICHHFKLDKGVHCKWVQRDRDKDSGWAHPYMGIYVSRAMVQEEPVQVEAMVDACLDEATRYLTGQQIPDNFLWGKPYIYGRREHNEHAIFSGDVNHWLDYAQKIDMCCTTFHKEFPPILKEWRDTIQMWHDGWNHHKPKHFWFDDATSPTEVIAHCKTQLDFVEKYIAADLDDVIQNMFRPNLSLQW